MVAIVLALVVLVQAAPATDSSVVIAAGTRIQAQLEQPLSTRTASANDTVVMRVTPELLVDSRVALPAGTTIIAALDSISHKSVWGNHLDVRMHLVRMVFADGDSIAFTQPVLGTSSDADRLHVEHTHGASEVVEVGAPVVGVAVGAAASGARGAVTGGALGVATGLVADLIGAAHGRDLVAEKGAQINIVLDSPLVLNRVQLLAAEQFAAAQPAFTPATKRKRCLVPGTPGTPDVTIPGSPPSYGADGVLQSPGSPPVVVPGAPATPDMWLPC